MPTECSAELFEFARVEGRSVMAAFDGGKITSDAGALLLGASNRAVGLIDRFAGCNSYVAVIKRDLGSPFDDKPVLGTL